MKTGVIAQDSNHATPWTLKLPADLPSAEVAKLRQRAEDLAERSQYGWGHTIEFGPFTMRGLLADKYIRLAALFDQYQWWPTDLTGLRVADVGCFTGGLSAIAASRAAEKVYAIDEVPEHLEQCKFVAEVFGLDAIQPVGCSLYQLPEHIEQESLDFIVFAGTLYHLSDMQVGLITLQRLLRPGGSMIIESNAVEDFDHSYANFGRFVGGMWWQPTALCVMDMCDFAGLNVAIDEMHFYQPERLVARVEKPASAHVKFRRGLNIAGIDRRDDEQRSLKPAQMAPAPNPKSQFRMLYGWLDKALRLPMRLGYFYRRLTR